MLVDNTLSKTSSPATPSFHLSFGFGGSDYLTWGSRCLLAGFGWCTCQRFLFLLRSGAILTKNFDWSSFFLGTWSDNLSEGA